MEEHEISAAVKLAGLGVITVFEVSRPDFSSAHAAKHHGFRLASIHLNDIKINEENNARQTLQRIIWFLYFGCVFSECKSF